MTGLAWEFQMPTLSLVANTVSLSAGNLQAMQALCYFSSILSDSLILCSSPEGKVKMETLPSALCSGILPPEASCSEVSSLKSYYEWHPRESILMGILTPHEGGALQRLDTSLSSVNLSIK